MDSLFDPAIQEQAATFHRNLRRSEQFYRQAAALITLDRLLQDEEVRHETQKPERELPFVGHHLSRIGERLLRSLRRRGPAGTQHASQPVPIIIDGAVNHDAIRSPKDIDPSPPGDGTATPDAAPQRDDLPDPSG